MAIGVTGGIGSGKTQVCRILASLGAMVLAADAIAREIIDTREDIKKKIRREFGAEIFRRNEMLDRKRMASLIFHDENKREKLDSIVHPFVIEAIIKRIQSAKRTGTNKLVVVEAALLFEAGADTIFDYTILVDSREQLRIERVMNRDKMIREDVYGRMRAQVLQKSKIGKADFVIRNSGNLKDLERKTIFLHKLLSILPNQRSIRVR